MSDGVLGDGRRDGSLQYTNGEVIFEEGSSDKEVYIILSGKVEVSQRVGGQNEAIAILEEGDFFGEMAPLVDEPRFATVTAVGDVLAETLSLDEFFQDMQTNPQRMRDVCMKLAKRLRDTTSQLNIMLLRVRTSEEDDLRGSRVSYFQKKVQEKDSEIESLRSQIDFSDRRPLWERLFRRDNARWLFSALWVIALLVISLVVLRLVKPEYWEMLVRVLGGSN